MDDATDTYIDTYKAAPEITAGLNFLASSDEKPVYYASEAGADAALSMDGQFEMCPVPIQNGRVADHAFSLDKQGFCLLQHVSAVSDFTDTAQISEIYEPDVQALLKQETGGSRVVVFDHTLRSDSSAVRETARSREPSRVIHNDYTETSAHVRVRDILPEEADDLLSGRFAIINVWRPVRGPVLTSPLAVCDATSLSPENLIPGERRAKDRIGELTLVTHNPAQKWFYFPAMTRDEALLIKTFDSVDDGRARASIHGAFDDPTSPPGAHPRESMETRCFVFFDE